MLCLFKKWHRRCWDTYKDKVASQSILLIITYVSIRAIYGFIIHDQLEGFYHSLIGLGFPLFFLINRKDIRNIGITLSIVAVFLRQGWIGIICIILTYAIIFWQDKRLWVIGAMSVVIPCSLIVSDKYIKPITKDLQGRITLYSETLDLIKKSNNFELYFGHGINAFAKLNIKKDDKWLDTVHNDLLQFIYDYGVISTGILLFLIFLPLYKFDFMPVANKVVFASYICLLFQCLVDFPFYRVIRPEMLYKATCVMGMLIIFFMYERNGEIN